MVAAAAALSSMAGAACCIATGRGCTHLSAHTHRHHLQEACPLHIALHGCCGRGRGGHGLHCLSIWLLLHTHCEAEADARSVRGREEASACRCNNSPSDPQRTVIERHDGCLTGRKAAVQSQQEAHLERRGYLPGHCMQLQTAVLGRLPPEAVIFCLNTVAAYKEVSVPWLTLSDAGHLAALKAIASSQVLPDGRTMMPKPHLSCSASACSKLSPLDVSPPAVGRKRGARCLSVAKVSACLGMMRGPALLWSSAPNPVAASGLACFDAGLRVRWGCPARPLAAPNVRLKPAAAGAVPLASEWPLACPRLLSAMPATELPNTCRRTGVALSSKELRSCKVVQL